MGEKNTLDVPKNAGFFEQWKIYRSLSLKSDYIKELISSEKFS